MDRKLIVKPGDWVQWYDYQEGRYYLGCVVRIGNRKYYPRDAMVFTDNGAVDLEDITEVRSSNKKDS